MQLPHRILLTGITLLLALVLACSTGDSESTAAPVATSTPVEAADDGHDDDDHADDEGHEAEAEPDIDLVALGRDIYGTVGCAACHGTDAEGSDIGPALSGHNALQVRRQVRAPIGVMTVFDQSTLSTADLAALVAYVESLEGGHAHATAPGQSVSEQSYMHHRMALTAFESENVEEAEHHIEHLIGVLEGQHLALMQEALEATHAGEIHDAQHLIEGMLADVLPPDQNLSTLHYQLALAGIRVGQTSDAVHHLEHVSAELIDPAAGNELTEILEFISSGDVVEAEEHLSHLMGLDPAGVDAGHVEGDEHATDDHDAEAAHEEGDEHAVDEHDAETTHVEGDEHATDEHEAEATHEEGDEHATDEHEAEATHEEGDEHATDEHEAEATHEEGDEHATDEHEAEATHEEGDEHATDEHEAEATHEEGDEHAEEEHTAEPAA